MTNISTPRRPGEALKLTLVVWGGGVLFARILLRTWNGRRGSENNARKRIRVLCTERKRFFPSHSSVNVEKERVEYRNRKLEFMAVL